LKEDFYESFIKGEEQNPVINNLKTNNRYAWVPIAPMSFLSGYDDQDVAYEDVHNAVKGIHSRGGNVKLFNIGEFDHDTGYYKILSQQIRIFNGHTDFKSSSS